MPKMACSGSTRGRPNLASTQQHRGDDAGPQPKRLARCQGVNFFYGHISVGPACHWGHLFLARLCSLTGTVVQKTRSDPPATPLTLLMSQRGQRIRSRRAPRRNERREHDAAQHDGHARANETPSVALTPNSTLRSSPLMPSATMIPKPGADRTEPQAAPEKRRTIDRPDAPSAMRMPISRVLCLTMYDTSPYVPSAASDHPGGTKDEQHRGRQVVEDQRAVRSVRSAAGRTGSAVRCRAPRRARAPGRPASTGAGPLRVQDHARPVHLQEWQVEVRPRRFVDPRILHVRGDADHRAPVTVGDAHALADRLRRVAPEPLRQRVVDDHDRRRRLIVVDPRTRRPATHAMRSVRK